MSRVQELHCTQCGEKMVDHFKFLCHDPDNGEKLYKCKAICPNKRWWNFHDVFERTVKTTSYLTGEVKHHYITFDENKEPTNL